MDIDMIMNLLCAFTTFYGNCYVLALVWLQDYSSKNVIVDERVLLI
jgi:hypothetical protein